MPKWIKYNEKKEEKAMPEPTPASSQEWPNHDETWFEFMCRVDCEKQQRFDLWTTIICTIAALTIVLVLYAEAIDKALV